MNIQNIDNSEVAKEFFKVLLNALNNGITDFNSPQGIEKQNIFDNINPELYLNPKFVVDNKLRQVKEELLELITKRNENAFNKFRSLLNVNSAKYYDVALLESTFNRVIDGHMRGVVDWETYNREMNRITGSFIYYVKTIELVDLK